MVLGVIKAVWGIIFFLRSWRCDRVCDQCSDELSGEKNYLERQKRKEVRRQESLQDRISLLLTIVLVVGVIVLCYVRSDSAAYGNNWKSDEQYCRFYSADAEWVREFTHNNREIMDLVNQVEFNPNKAIQWGMSILGNGAGNFMNTTMTAVGSIVSGVTTFFIAFSFCLLYSFPERKLHVQVRKVFFAFIPKRKAEVILEVCSPDLPYLSQTSLPDSAWKR